MCSAVLLPGPRPGACLPGRASCLLAGASPALSPLALAARGHACGHVRAWHLPLPEAFRFPERGFTECGVQVRIGTTVNLRPREAPCSPARPLGSQVGTGGDSPIQLCPNLFRELVPRRWQTCCSAVLALGAKTSFSLWDAGVCPGPAGQVSARLCSFWRPQEKPFPCFLPLREAAHAPWPVAPGQQCHD